MSASPVIVALDFADVSDAAVLVAKLDPSRCRLKVGKELFVRAGPDYVGALIKDGFDVFLDLKFHDIPNTVSGACRAVVDLGVWMLNVHAAGGDAMLAAAREAVPTAVGAPKLIAVTVLTSFGDSDLHQVGVATSVSDQCLVLARAARGHGLDGVVCSAREAGAIRDACGADFDRVTPGIRPANSARGDQTRVVTPADAMRAGSSYLVIGRPITEAPDPMMAISGIEQELGLSS